MHLDWPFIATFLRDYAKREKLSGQVLGKYRGAYDLTQGQSRWRKHPGQLKRSLMARMTGELEAEYDSLIYGKAWEFGFHRKRYFVAPRIAKALTWHVGGNKWAFSRGHWIPAQTFEARPWMRPAYEETRDRLRAQANQFGEPTVLRLCDLLAVAVDDMRQGGDPRLPLELAIVKVTRPGADLSQAC